MQSLGICPNFLGGAHHVSAPYAQRVATGLAYVVANRRVRVPLRRQVGLAGKNGARLQA